MNKFPSLGDVAVDVGFPKNPFPNKSDLPFTSVANHCYYTTSWTTDYFGTNILEFSLVPTLMIMESYKLW
jgi:hypothetical protein